MVIKQQKLNKKFPTLSKKIYVKNFHDSLTTVVKAQNDTSETANITFLILHVERYTRPYQ